MRVEPKLSRRIVNQLESERGQSDAGSVLTPQAGIAVPDVNLLHGHD